MRYPLCLSALTLLGCTPVTNDHEGTSNRSDSANGEQINGTKADSKKLRGSSWRIVSINGAPAASFNKEHPATLEFGNSDARGSSGCNQYGGIYLQVNTKLYFGDVISTQMGCPGKQEASLFTLFFGPIDVSFDADGRLHLVRDATEVILTRNETCANCDERYQKAPSLSGTKWKIETINGKVPVGLNAKANTDRYRVSFTDNEVAYQAGCNSFNAPYQRKDNQFFRAKLVNMTAMECLGAEGEEDSAVDAVFGSNPVFVIGPNGDMILASETGMLRLRR